MGDLRKKLYDELFVGAGVTGFSFELAAGRPAPRYGR